MQITNSTAAADFVSVTDAKQFADGANSSSCIFTVQEDSTPEANETFTVQIFIQSGVATIGPDNTSYLTILSNDDPYGIIQFQNVSMIIGKTYLSAICALSIKTIVWLMMKY